MRAASASTWLPLSLPALAYRKQNFVWYKRVRVGLARDAEADQFRRFAAQVLVRGSGFAGREFAHRECGDPLYVLARDFPSRYDGASALDAAASPAAPSQECRDVDAAGGLRRSSAAAQFLSADRALWSAHSKSLFRKKSLQPSSSFPEPSFVSQLAACPAARSDRSRFSVFHAKRRI